MKTKYHQNLKMHFYTHNNITHNNKHTRHWAWALDTCQFIVNSDKMVKKHDVLYLLSGMHSISRQTDIELIPMVFYLTKWPNLVPRVFGNNTKQHQQHTNNSDLSTVKKFKHI